MEVEERLLTQLEWQSALLEVTAYDRLLFCTALVVLMQCGFALVEAGTCRTKNVVSIMMKNQCDSVVCILLWFSIGKAMAYGDATQTAGLVGTSGFFEVALFKDGAIELFEASQFHFTSAFCAVAATIVSGGIAERTQLAGYLIFSTMMSSFIYPLIVCWCWNPDGWLHSLGFYDFAGGGVVHLTGGTAALCGAIIVGPRHGRFTLMGHKHFAPHSVPFIQMGTLILWFGWYGFNAGSAGHFETTDNFDEAILASINTTLAASSGGLALLLLQGLLNQPYSVPHICNGMLAGLVSVTGSCSVVTPWSGVAIAAIGALLYSVSYKVVASLRIDDPVGAFSVHGVGGFWGILSASIFHRGVNASGHDIPVPKLEVQLLAAAVIIIFVALCAIGIFKTIVVLGLGRVSVHGQSFGDEAERRYETMAYSGLDDSRYSAFMCHAKVRRGACARWIQLELSKIVGTGKIFIDADNLVNLGALLTTVREKVDALIVLTSEEIWGRPWCAGEITSAYLATVPTVLVSIGPNPVHQSAKYFVDCRDAVAKNLTDKDFDMLAPYGIGQDDIEEAYENLKEAPQVLFALGGHKDGVKLVAQAAGLTAPSHKLSSWAECVNTTSAALSPKRMRPQALVSLKRKTSASLYSTILIIGDDENVEAIAAMHICRHGLVEAGCLDHGAQVVCAPDLSHSEALVRSLTSGCGLVLLLSRGVLESSFVQQVFLLRAAQAGGFGRTWRELQTEFQVQQTHSPRDLRRGAVHLEQSVVLLHADRLGFEFPTQDLFPWLLEHEHPKTTEGLSQYMLPYQSAEERAASLASCYHSLFKLIAVPLSTHGSWVAMQHQFAIIMDRMEVVGFCPFNEVLRLSTASSPPHSHCSNESPQSIVIDEVPKARFGAEGVRGDRFRSDEQFTGLVSEVRVETIRHQRSLSTTFSKGSGASHEDRRRQSRLMPL